MPPLQAQPDDATLTQVLDGLRSEGYQGDVVLDEDGGLRCTSCGTITAADDVRMDGLRRVEGVSDPADMAAVLAITCATCGERGSAVVRYGPEAGPGDSALLLAIDDQRPPGLDVAERASTDEPAASDGSPAGSPGKSDEQAPDADKAVGDFGRDGQSDQGGDSDVDVSSDR